MTDGTVQNLFEPVIAEFNRSFIKGFIGLGVDINRVMFLELNYNQGLTPRINNSDLKITSYYVEFALGFVLFKRNEISEPVSEE